ncbi:hypothetical protein CAPTEDRAFT_213373, partial [Capitella teleta]
CTIYDARPLFGPVAGGTEVLLSGDGLPGCVPVNVTFSVNSFLLLATYLSLNFTSSSTISLVTYPLSDLSYISKPLPIMVDYEDGTSLDTGFNFTYLGDPVISDVYPLQHIPQGGTTITVNGTNLNSVSDPKMNLTQIHTVETTTGSLTVTSKNYITDCTVAGANNMTCPVAELDLPPDYADAITEAQSSASQQLSSTSTLDFWIGFLLDGVDTFKNISEVQGLEDKKFQLGPPVFEIGDLPDYNPDKEMYIAINGKLGYWVGRKHEIGVAVSGEQCAIFNIFSNKIQCVPPAEEDVMKGKELTLCSKGHSVKVAVGNSDTFIGCVSYVDNSDLNLPIILGAIGVFVVFVVVAGIGILSCRKKPPISSLALSEHVGFPQDAEDEVTPTQKQTGLRRIEEHDADTRWDQIDKGARLPREGDRRDRRGRDQKGPPDPQYVNEDHDRNWGEMLKPKDPRNALPRESPAIFYPKARSAGQPKPSQPGVPEAYTTWLAREADDEGEPDMYWQGAKGMPIVNRLPYVNDPGPAMRSIDRGYNNQRRNVQSDIFPDDINLMR